ncbi:MAG: DnaJ domain-containing protein [Chloroflexota bacterium]
MPEKAQLWLQAQIKQLPSVRACALSRGSADLRIRTWMGMSVSVYFIDGVPNLRALRRELQDNTRAYSATMFVALHRLMPADKTRLIPEEWMQALHDLNSGRIYTYMPGQSGMHQVHFDHLPDGTQREAWHGGPVEFEKLRITKASTSVRALRGTNYMMGDFGGNPYWTNRNFRAERLNERYWRQRQRVGGYVWGQYDVGGMPGGATDAALNRAHSPLQHSYMVLGIEMDASRDEVKAAYRQMARQFHPDTSELPTNEAQERFHEISTAYEYIKVTQQWT